MAEKWYRHAMIGLGLFVLINGVAFVIVSLLQYQNISRLENYDRSLSWDLGWVKEEIKTKEDLSPLVQDLVNAALRNLYPWLHHARHHMSNHNHGHHYELYRKYEERARHKRFLGIVDILQDILNEQEKVIERYCSGNHTGTCAKGPKGFTGPRGDEGPKGLSGVPGSKGDPGMPGLKGQKGVLGPRGQKGTKGQQGVKGDPGIRGIKGIKGQPGPKGNQGPPGAKGHKGSKGNQGVQGQVGDRGLKGIKGEKGAQGPKGEPGIPGEKGARGPQGLPGPSTHQIRPGCECLKRPKMIGSHRQTLKVPLGGNVTLTCAAEGNPQPTIKWEGFPGRTIDIRHTAPADYRHYVCTASNVFGEDRKYVTLTH